MKSISIVLLLLTALSTTAFAQVDGDGPQNSSMESDGCANFVSMYALNAVINDMVLEQKSIQKNNFYPGQLVLEKTIENNDGITKSYTTVITVVDKEAPSPIRYNISLKVEDHDASCILVKNSLKIEFEN